MWWGVGAALLANVLYSTGFVLEKRALGSLPEVTVRRPGRLLRLVLGSPLWIGGALALAAGFAAQLVVYRTLPIAAAQGIFVSGLVLLVLLSARLLGERTTGRERYALGAILLALLMVVLSLDEGADTVGADAPYPLVLTVCLPSLAGGLWLYRRAERGTRRRHRQPTTGVAYGVAVGLLYGVSSLAIKGVSSRMAADGSGADVPGALTGVLGSPYPYLLLFTGVFGLVMSQAALQRCRASLIVPVCTTVSCLFTAVLGTLTFGEALPADPLRLGLRVTGTALAVAVLLAMPKHDEPPSREGAQADPRPPAAEATGEPSAEAAGQPPAGAAGAPGTHSAPVPVRHPLPRTETRPETRTDTRPESRPEARPVTSPSSGPVDEEPTPS